MKIISKFFVFFQKPVLMTIAISKNPGHLTHQECDGGIVTLAKNASRKDTITCSRCAKKAEFEPVYAQLFGFTKEDGKPRNITISRYHDEIVRGRIHIISPPPPHK
ncbi:MAG: hypothetical protein NUV61_04410 [Candidatus Azambacteria bacterium]|nr:hypothetical protein [Candidatus Azambacteria bacterium]